MVTATSDGDTHDTNPFKTKGGAVLVETLASMVMPATTKAKLLGVVSRGRPAAAPAPAAARRFLRRGRTGGEGPRA